MYIIPVKITLFNTFRYGTCNPFAHSPILNPLTLCEEVYQKGKDYVYISNLETIDYYTNLLNAIGATEQVLKENFINDNCTSKIMRTICHYYLPPCGNSTHFEPPTSVCEAVCDLLSEECELLLSVFQQQLMELTGDNFNCSISIIDPLPHSCTNLGFETNCKLCR